MLVSSGSFSIVPCVPFYVYIMVIGVSWELYSSILLNCCMHGSVYYFIKVSLKCASSADASVVCSGCSELLAFSIY